MVLTESGTECTLVHGNSQNFLAASAPSVVTEDDDYGQEGIFDTANWAFSSTKIQGFYLFNIQRTYWALVFHVIKLCKPLS